MINPGKPQYMRKETLAALKQFLQQLKTIKRQEIAQRLQEAKSLGDLSENAEYQEAKEAQSKNEKEIAEKEDKIKSAVLYEKPTKKNIVSIGATIKVKSDGEEKIFTIVGSEEADPTGGEISNESLLGEALLGRKSGEEIEVKTPKAKTPVRYKILHIG